MNALHILPNGNTHMDTDTQTYTQRHAQRHTDHPPTRDTDPQTETHTYKHTRTHTDMPLQRDTHTHRPPKDTSLPTHRNTSTHKPLPQRQTHTHTHTHTSSHSQKPGVRLDFALSLSSIFNQFVAYLAKFTFHIYFKINSLLSSLLELCFHSKPHYLPTELLL